MDDPARLLARLDALTPRDERWLRELGVRGLGLPAVAAQFGISERAAALHLVRAARAYAGLPALRPDEEAHAAALAQRGELPPPLSKALAELRAQAGPIEALTEARLEARERRLRPLRWIAAAILVALAWFLSRGH